MNLSWRKCSVCKVEIPLNAKYYQCSVSTCNAKATGLVFCSVPCFERHLPGARHRDAAAIENTAPSVPYQPEVSGRQEGTRRIIATPAASMSAGKVALKGSADTTEILVVVSKLKKYIQDQSGMNTSQSVMNLLSDKLRALCDNAVLEAEKDGRKTVMERDFK